MQYVKSFLLIEKKYPAYAKIVSQQITKYITLTKTSLPE